MAIEPGSLPGLKAFSYLLPPDLDNVAARSHGNAIGYIPKLAFTFEPAGAALACIGIAVAMPDIVQDGRPADHGPGSRTMAFDPFLARLLGDHLGAQALGGRAQIALEPGCFPLCGAFAFGVGRDLVVPV